ncbi:Metallo-dependent phosphatase-like protein [Aspergillus granulosus]|uniref:Metallo-dependent phosphatase-like protein n=1 Tax=Aspergillus granulosus TaxID=176169 RepID=A0ABR4I5X0_9EURO
MFEKVHSIFNKHSTSFQVLSDLHLEVNQQYLSFEVPRCSKHLILAGDVGRLVDYDSYRGFLQKQTDQFELVFLILGNHEFYDDTFAAGLQKARQLEQEPSLNGRLILLHQGRYDIPGSNITILGCTLWSKVPDEARDIVQLMIQDFKNIRDWTVGDHNGSHEADLAWLLSEIESIRNKNKTQTEKRSILVVTHHAPSLHKTSSPQHANNPWSSAFGTEILPQIPKSSGVKAWIFGHTHYTTEFKNQGIRIMANQRGYVFPGTSKGSKDGFDVGKVICM